MKTLAAICLLLLASCSKSSPDATQKVCYTFTFMQSIGGPSCERTATLDTCIDPWVDVTKLKFTDKCNNDLGWSAKIR